MAYTPTNYQDHIIEYPNRHKITHTDGSEEVVTITREPGTIIQQGTSVNAANLNKSEAGIEQAHADIESLTTQMADLVKVKPNITILSANWVDDTATSGFFIYDIIDTDIDVNTVVNVNIHLSSLEVASILKSVTESYAGYARLYADSQPAADISADIVLQKAVA